MAQKQSWRDIFDLRRDQERANVIDAEIREGVTLSGTNLWVLMFAILIASIGLNVNSSAVIIGAMLISPLMGPIVGVGYGAGVNDLALIKLSLRSWLLCIFIGLISATLYFTLTPLTQAQSELLARTQPTLWDVLIAFFGGCAGIVAMTRKNISNVIPGVAIATALMPPLCTAGYGIAIGNWSYFGGAFYLFAINSVFIAFATLLFTRLLKLPMRGRLDDTAQSLSRVVIVICTLGLMIPSGWLAYRLVKNELFTTRVNQLLMEVSRSGNTIVLSHEIQADARQVRLIVGGSRPPVGLQTALREKLHEAGIKDPQVTVIYAGSDQPNIDLIKQDLQNSLYQNTFQQLSVQADEIKRLEAENHRLAAFRDNEAETLQELRAQFPDAVQISLTFGSLSLHGDKNLKTPPTDAQPTPSEKQEKAVVALWLETAKALSSEDKDRLQRWLQVRFAERGEVHVYNTVTAPAASRKKGKN